MHMHEGQLKALSEQIEQLKAEHYVFVSCSTWNEGNTPVTYNAHFDILLKMTLNGKVTNIIVGIYGQIYYMP
jgi:flavodoxin